MGTPTQITSHHHHHTNLQRHDDNDKISATIKTNPPSMRTKPMFGLYHDHHHSDDHNNAHS